VVYLFLVSYGRSAKPEQINMVIPFFLQVRDSYWLALQALTTSQDVNDRNPLIRALAIRTMSYIPIPVVTEALTENLRHCLRDRDPYVRKTAAICVAKLYAADPRKAEKGGFVEMLRDLMLDSNATVVANAVAALSEIGDRPDGVIYKLNLTTANKLLAALTESSEYVLSSSPRMPADGH
jgi:AP-2 complex subunit beta-1